MSWRRLCNPKKMGGMGFCDLHAFNLALQNKHGSWFRKRTLFFYRIYKARYFPTTEFLEAEMGHNPSYVWRSLLSAREIVLAGSRWQVGDGKTIKVSSHAWLTHPPRLNGDIRKDMHLPELIN